MKKRCVIWVYLARETYPRFRRSLMRDVNSTLKDEVSGFDAIKSDRAGQASEDDWQLAMTVG